jgi:mitochondrial inner membrane protease subunit 1
MQPTLFSNNILVCNKITHRMNNLKRNDIVIAIHPSNPQNLICKRLIAIPGDIVLMNSPKNSKSDEGGTETETIYIKSGKVWLEGDNRINSTDSRNYGQVGG